MGKALKVTDTVKSNVAQAGHNWMGYDWGIDKATVVFAGMAGGLNPEALISMALPVYGSSRLVAPSLRSSTAKKSSTSLRLPAASSQRRSSYIPRSASRPSRTSRG